MNDIELDCKITRDIADCISLAIDDFIGEDEIDNIKRDAILSGIAYNLCFYSYIFKIGKTQIFSTFSQTVDLVYADLKEQDENRNGCH